MKVQYIASACVVIEHRGTRILCDPWLTDGIYYGSWYHYPRLQFRPEDFSDVDYIYVSHVHPDHMDVESLKCLPRSVPVLILEYAEKYVLRTLTGLGFGVIEIPNGGSKTLGPDFTVELFAADNCDPQVCARFMGCAPQPYYSKTLWIDSVAVFRGGGRTVVNSNDCPYELSHTVCSVIASKYGPVDLALVGYSGAGEYPQCFDNLDENGKREKAEVKRAQFLHQAVRFVTHLNARICLPFAGQYTLGGRLASLNGLRGVPELDDAGLALARLLEQEKAHAEVVLLNSGEHYDVDTGRPSAAFVPPDPQLRERYIQDVLSTKKFVYEVNPVEDRGDLTAKLSEAHARLARHQKLWGYSSPWRVYLDAGQGYLYAVPFDGSHVTTTSPGEEVEPFVRITLDYTLLDMILDRKAHWNNASTGSHLRFFRRPDTYERAIYTLLSYLHR